MKQGKIWILGLAAVIALALSGCGGNGIGGNDNQAASPPTSSHDSALAGSWFDLAYNLVAAQGYPPMIAARIYGYLTLAFYEAVVDGMPGHRSMVGQLNAFTTRPASDPTLVYDWPLVANASLAAAAASLYINPTAATTAAFASQEALWVTIRSFAVPPDVVARSSALGDSIGAAVAAYAATDGFSTFVSCPYTAPVGPGLWEPTPAGFAPPLQPCWGQLRPLALVNGAECPANLPLPYSEDPTSAFFMEALEVYNTVNLMDPTNQEIANFWNDNPVATGTPAGHWIGIVTDLIGDNQYSLDIAADAYVRVGIAVNDAFIAAWFTKYQYNLLRPVTYIRDLIDSTWSPFIGTPPFPEHTSGHSTQSGAAATMLTSLFGDLPFVDDSKDFLGVPSRSFTSFQAAADEAAVSRLYGGIHFRNGNESGLAQGRCIGQTILSRIQFTN